MPSMSASSPPPSSQKNFFADLVNLKIHVPNNKKDELYTHLKRTGRIKKIERYLKKYEAEDTEKSKITYRLTCNYHPDKDPETLGCFEGIGERTGFTSVVKSVKRSVGTIASTDLGVTRTLGKGLSKISGKVIGEPNTRYIAKKITDKFSSAKSSVSKGVSSCSSAVSNCGGALSGYIKFISFQRCFSAST